MIKLYTGATPNGQKIPLLLELLHLKYEMVKLDLQAGEHKKPEYLAINPNGMIPALVDPSTNTTITETAAILTYLADTYDKERKFSYEYKTPEYYKQLEMMYFQMSGLGPMMMQLTHFAKFAPEKIPYAMKRYSDETKRALAVLNEHLKRNGTGFLAGDHVSIADLCTISFAIPIPVLGISYDDYPEVKKWIQKMVEIPEIYDGFRKIYEPLFWPSKEMLASPSL